MQVEGGKLDRGHQCPGTYQDGCEGEGGAGGRHGLKGCKLKTVEDKVCMSRGAFLGGGGEVCRLREGKWIEAINGLAPIRTAVRGKVELGDVMGRKGFELETVEDKVRAGGGVEIWVGEGAQAVEGKGYVVGAKGKGFTWVELGYRER